MILCFLLSKSANADYIKDLKIEEMSIGDLILLCVTMFKKKRITKL